MGLEASRKASYQPNKITLISVYFSTQKLFIIEAFPFQIHIIAFILLHWEDPRDNGWIWLSLLLQLIC